MSGLTINICHCNKTLKFRQCSNVFQAWWKVVPCQRSTEIKRVDTSCRSGFRNVDSGTMSKWISAYLCGESIPHNFRAYEIDWFENLRFLVWMLGVIVSSRTSADVIEWQLSFAHSARCCVSLMRLCACLLKNIHTKGQ